jgi:hypothetical protein
MRHAIRRLLPVALLVGALVLAGSAPAGATASNGFSSTYAFDYIVWGDNHFHITGDGTVTVTLHGTSGPSRPVDIKIERETCGVFGCHWKENYVGGTCTRTLYVGATTTCSFRPVNDGKAHRIVMSKRRDGDELRGTVRAR